MEKKWLILRLHDGFNEYFRCGDGTYTINTAKHYTLKDLLESGRKVTSVVHVETNQVYSLKDKVKIINDLNASQEMEIVDLQVVHGSEAIQLILK